MAEFLTGQQLNARLESIIEDAVYELFLISPFIKLNPHLKEKLLNKKDDPNFHLLIVFGKNKDAIHKSLPLEQFEFFKDFADVTIKYEERLHAKYYANENVALLSSMNLYDYSINNNIEFGVMVEHSLMGGTSSKIERQAKAYFDTVFSNAVTLFDRETEGTKNLIGQFKYTGSVTKVDKLTQMYGSAIKVVENQKVSRRTGYCIRTGVDIPFNVKRPYSDKSFKSWNRYRNHTYPEKYCHFSGDKG